MPYLTEPHNIEILMMVGCGDRIRTQAEVARLFAEVHLELPPVSKEKSYRELGHVRDAPRQRP
ncbi:hypothetical protein NQ315_010637 [Exocentrus adspersus]|uniref:Uncharacterized protein n=1 Tax=Exocentrus adspersus TaxID=1586481 RepID=A0AAV8W6G7_9CUCU|nr:hypothetical protein NQ315_010637 [Exocentrus adspersus]